MIINRNLSEKIRNSAREFPSVTLTGPRQSGKTTLCKALFPKHPYASLEAADVRAFAIEDPVRFLAQFPEGAIIDEVQRVPDILSYLQVKIDENRDVGY